MGTIYVPDNKHSNDELVSCNSSDKDREDGKSKEKKWVV